MDKVYISWSIENWITVVLMVSLGYFLVSFVASIVRSRMGGLGLANGAVNSLSGSMPGISGVSG